MQTNTVFLPESQTNEAPRPDDIPGMDASWLFPLSFLLLLPAPILLSCCAAAALIALLCRFSLKSKPF